MQPRLAFCQPWFSLHTMTQPQKLGSDSAGEAGKRAATLPADGTGSGFPEAPPTKLPTSGILRYGWDLLKQHPRYIASFLILSLVQAVVTVGTPVLWGPLAGAMASAKTSPPQVISTSVLNVRTRIESLSVGWLFALWSGLFLAGVAITLAARCVQTMLDVSMANRLRDQLFEVVLRKHAAFFHSRDHDPGRLTTIVNQTAVQTQMILRQMLLDPVVQLVSCGMAVSAIGFSFSRIKGGGPLWLWGV